MLLHALTVFVSAFLLFLVQPIIAKQIVPWFGGSAGVWSTCLVFFQLALLAGYLYADWTTRKLPLKRQVILHTGLIAIALFLLPILPDASWKPYSGEHLGNEQPSLRILLLLTATIGLPYFLLSTTSPLVQAWFARAHPTANPYRLFALSNLASMLALLGYPFLVEPNLSSRYQAIEWSIGFAVFAVLIATVMWRGVRLDKRSEGMPLPTVAPIAQPAPTNADKAIWVTLAALGTTLLLGVSNHLTQNIASIPLLWVVPLAIYLLTFILCFSGKQGATRWYPYGIALSQAALAVVAMAWLLAEKRLDFMLLLHMIVFMSGLFITCMFCHGELAARKPGASHLTTFYLMIAIGGALGALLVGILAPLMLSGYYELGMVLIVLAVLGTWLQRRRLQWQWMVAGCAVCLFTIWSAVHSFNGYRIGTVIMSRNFYGTLRVQDSSGPDVDRKRSLLHGSILHGDQYLDARRRTIATTYYRNSSGIAIALREQANRLNRPRRVGIIGLGAGTLAAYGNKGDVFRFYDINPAVVTIARRDFTYLNDSNASIEIALGDARLTLEREAPQQFDVLVIDAFAGDSIPVHLITLDAFDVYEKHLHPGGIIAFHVSNRFLDLTSVLGRLADARGLDVAWISDKHDDGRAASEWVLLGRRPSVLESPSIQRAAQPIVMRPNAQVWTDDFNNIVQVLK